MENEGRSQYWFLKISILKDVFLEHLLGLSPKGFLKASFTFYEALMLWNDGLYGESPCGIYTGKRVLYFFRA